MQPCLRDAPPASQPSAAQGERSSALHNLLRCHRQPSPGRQPPSPLIRPSQEIPLWHGTLVCTPRAAALFRRRLLGYRDGHATDLAAAVALPIHTAQALPGCRPTAPPPPPQISTTILRRFCCIRNGFTGRWTGLLPSQARTEQPCGLRSARESQADSIGAWMREGLGTYISVLLTALRCRHARCRARRLTLRRDRWRLVCAYALSDSLHPLYVW